MAEYGKMKALKVPKPSGEADYDAKMSELDYPGTKGVSLPEGGKQQVSGFKFSGTY
jgi:hypothetical protein